MQIYQCHKLICFGGIRSIVMSHANHKLLHAQNKKKIARRNQNKDLYLDTMFTCWYTSLILDNN
jgi:hypothetical protein